MHTRCVEHSFLMLNNLSQILECTSLVNTQISANTDNTGEGTLIVPAGSSHPQASPLQSMSRHLDHHPGQSKQASWLLLSAEQGTICCSKSCNHQACQSLMDAPNKKAEVDLLVPSCDSTPLAQCASMPGTPKTVLITRTATFCAGTLCAAA